MTDWAGNLTRVNELRDIVEAEPAAVASLAEELLELAHNEEWSVQRAAVDALGVGLINCPEAGMPKLDAIIRTALDETVPSPDRWRNGVVSLAGTAPEAVRDTALSGFEAIPSDQRGDAGEGCVARALERIAVDNPAVIAHSLKALRDICRTSAPRARRHLLGAHLALVDSCPQAVRPVLPELLAEFDAGGGKTRCVAADLLCALATHPKEGPAVIKAMIRWLATRPQSPHEHRPGLTPRDSVMHPSLTDNPESGVLGVTQVLARIAEETPDAVVPHCGDIATSLAAWKSTQGDQWPRSHLARALAAVARQRPQAIVLIGDDVPELLHDDSEFVRYWAAQTLLALFPYRPDIVSTMVIGSVLTDSNLDVRGLGADLAAGCVADGIVNCDDVVAELQKTLSTDAALQRRRLLSVVASVARQDPQAVRPVLSTVEQSLTEAHTASEAAATFEAVASADTEPISDAVPTLVDCLFTDSLLVRAAVAETLVTIGRTRPSLLDDQLSVLTSVIGHEHAGVDAVGDVLATVADRSLDEDRTVYEFVRARSAADSAVVRRTATRLLGAFIEADVETEQTVTALTDRVSDTDQQVRDVALDALATRVADTGAAALVRSCYQTGTSHWQAVTADLIARATLLDGAWPSAEFQRWLADCLHETTGETRRSFIEATGHICGQVDAEPELVSALLECLDDETVAEASFTTVQNIAAYGETTIPGSELAPAVELTILNTDREIPSGCVALLPHIASSIDAAQQVADHLLTRLTANNGDTGELAAALAALCPTGVTLPAPDIVSTLERYAIERGVSARDRTCKDFARVLQETDDGDTLLRDTFVPMAAKGPRDRRAKAYSVLASVADEWPAAIQPAVGTLHVGARADDKQISSPALSALVAIGRVSPGVLHPVADQAISHRASSDHIELRRRQYEALALLTAHEADLDETGFWTLRSGLLDNDTAITEYALQATAERNDRRMAPVLQRLNNSVPDWGSLPAHSQTASEREDVQFEELLSSNERMRTAGDVLQILGQ